MMNHNQINVFHLGTWGLSESQTHNSYLLQNNNQYILIDLPPIQLYETLIHALEEHTLLSNILYIIIQSMTMSHISVLLKLSEAGYGGKIITNIFFAKQLIDAKLDLEIHLVEEMNYQMQLNEETHLHFIPMRFLPYPKMFMTYLSSHHALFSSTLFSSFYSHGDDPNLHEMKMSLFAFHKYMMPSSEFTRVPLNALGDYIIDDIYPLKGYMIHKDIVSDIIDYLKRCTFHNDNQVFADSDYDLEITQFNEMMNRALEQLQQHVSDIEIREVFIDSSFQLDADRMEVKVSSQSDFALWESFFNHIHLKKGIAWLLLLEPLVRRYYNIFGIEMPSVYQSELFQITRQYEALENEKEQLQQRIEEINAQWEQTEIESYQCPITKLFNQDFLAQLLQSEFSQEVDAPPLRAFFLVHIDQLNDINRRYGKETGDETIRNMNYLLQQTIREGVQLFKQHGPGIILYDPNATPTSVAKCATRARNAIYESDVFIEKVTASVSVVTSLEWDITQPIDEQIKNIFLLLEKRMIVAKSIGHGSIVDQSNASSELKEGVILLVDEDEINQNMLYRFFQRVHFEVKIARDVEEALKIIEEKTIDIIISEINLSKMDGFALKRTLNESKAFKKIPFIMVSHNKTLENIKRGNILEVDLILEKPIIPEELIGHVQRLKNRDKNV